MIQVVDPGETIDYLFYVDTFQAYIRVASDNFDDFNEYLWRDSIEET